MEPRISLVTLGVTDLARSIAFYEALGWQRSMKEAEGVAFFQLGGLILSLYPDLAKDAGTPDIKGPGAFSLSHNVRAEDDVDVIVDKLVLLGATITAPTRTMPWGGRVAYLADPDGFSWEIAWNPDFPIAGDGTISMPG
ncbi:MAG: VOC family protein [Candidatus Devosia phytovorans]|uniref:VOC family protein n=1 Tax=Candidatus Devosia phytovorans TaxID=3121372 RepID=A0AAJ6AZS5_9HYPH|nr:VOC family protein [Devosia sp.]WEK04447.1 MAG: VOC family protein [Devosia sp.]